MKPAIAPSTEQMYEALAPLAAGDEQADWPFLRFCDVFCRSFIEPVASLIEETNDQPAWSAVFDPDRCPPIALAFLGQFVGQRRLQNDELMRAAIKSPGGFRRGTVESMIAAVKPHLSGTRAIHLEERRGGSAYSLRVRVLAYQVVDEAALRAAIEADRIVGEVIEVDIVSGQSWEDVDVQHSDWADVASSYSDWEEVASSLPPIGSGSGD